MTCAEVADHCSDKNIRCSVQEREFMLTFCKTTSMENNVQLWTRRKLRHHARGIWKRFVCTPFLPVDMEQRNEVILKVYIHADLPGTVEDIQSEEDTLLYRQAHPGRIFCLEKESSDLVLTCDGQENILVAKDVFKKRQTATSIIISDTTQAKMIILSVRENDSVNMLFEMTFMAFLKEAVSWGKSPRGVKRLKTASQPEVDDEWSKEDGSMKDITVNQYYQLGVAHGLSCRTLDSIQYRCSRYMKSGRSISHRAALQMDREWQSLCGQDSRAGEHLREISESIKDGRPSRKRHSGNSSAASTSSSSRGQHSLSDECNVSDAHIRNLSKLLPPDVYYDLQIPLGIEYAITEGIKRQTPDTSEQFMHLIQKWKVKSPRTLADLDHALIKAGAGGVIYKYKKGILE